MGWYRTGTITLVAGSDVVRGAGTAWVRNALPGDILSVPGAVLEVKRIVSDTELQLASAYTGAGGAGLSYALVPTQGYVPEALQAMQQILGEFGDIWQAWQAGDLQGRGLVLKGSVDAVEDLPTEGNAAGDGYIVAGSELHVWNGTAWAYAGEMVTTPALLQARQDAVDAAAVAAAHLAATVVNAGRAEDARDVSELYAGVLYRPATLAELNGLPGTANGQWALINVGGAEDGLYQKVAGVWTFKAKTGLMSKLDSAIFQLAVIALSSMRQAGGSDAIVLAADASPDPKVLIGCELPAAGGYLLARFKPLIGEFAEAVIATLAPRLSQLRFYAGDPSLSVLLADTPPNPGDPLNVLFGFDSAAKLPIIANLDALIASIVPGLALKKTAGIYGLIGVGQSNIVGSTATPVLTGSQPYQNLTFSGGPKATKAGSVGSNAGTDAFKPLVEDELSGDGMSGRGETFCSRAANEVTRRRLYRGYTVEQSVVFASTSGHGGYRIDQLDSPAVWFQVFKDHCTSAKALADLAGKSMRIVGFPFAQGEAQLDAGVSMEATKAQLLAYQANCEAFVNETFGTPGRVPFLCYATPYKSKDSGGALLQLLFEMCRDYPDRFVHVTTIANLRSSDGTHLANDGQAIFGYYIGRVADQLIAGEAPQALRAVSATTSDRKTIRVRFNVPQLPLRFDVAGVGRISISGVDNHGFRIATQSGTQLIQSVSIDGRDVVIVLAAAYSAGDAASAQARIGLDYWTDPDSDIHRTICNLRDSTADTTEVGGIQRDCSHLAQPCWLPIQIVY